MRNRNDKETRHGEHETIGDIARVCLSTSLPSQIIDLIHETYSIYAHSIQKLVGRNQLYAKENTENRFHLPRRTPKRKKKVNRKTYLPAPESLARAPPQALAAVGTRTRRRIVADRPDAPFSRRLCASSVRRRWSA